MTQRLINDNNIINGRTRSLYDYPNDAHARCSVQRRPFHWRRRREIFSHSSLQALPFSSPLLALRFTQSPREAATNAGCDMTRHAIIACRRTRSSRQARSKGATNSVETHSPTFTLGTPQHFSRTYRMAHKHQPPPNVIHCRIRAPVHSRTARMTAHASSGVHLSLGCIKRPVRPFNSSCKPRQGRNYVHHARGPLLAPSPLSCIIHDSYFPEAF